MRCTYAASIIDVPDKGRSRWEQPDAMLRLKQTSRGLWQRGLRLFDDRLECGRLVDREIGQHLAIDGDLGPGEPVDKSAVGETEGTHGCVQSLNPQRTERA